MAVILEVIEAFWNMILSFFASVPGAIILLIVGFVLLIKGADYFVEGASNVAKRLKIPSLIIGLTIVAMGTSLPETAVSIEASINNENSLAISNVSGSNLVNLLVVVGICAVLQTVLVDKDTIKRDIPYSIISAVVLMTLGAWVTGDGELNRLDGIILLMMFVAFLLLMARSALKARHEHGEEPDEGITQTVFVSILSIVGGVVAIKFGGDWVVGGATTIADACGLSPTIIGLTIVAVGTSLPELVTSVVAARKGEVDMALGNAFGSNVFNILMVLGVASAISPIKFATENLMDIGAVIVSSLVVWAVVAKTKEIRRPMGIVMILMYIAYMVFVVLRELQIIELPF